MFSLCWVPLGSPLYLLHQQQQQRHLASTFSHFHYPGSPGPPGSPRSGLHPSLTRVASSPSFSSSGQRSTSPTAGLWPSPSQPLFSLANVISMAMTMAQSLAPPPSYQPQYQPAPQEASCPAADRRTLADGLAPPFQPGLASSLQEAEVGWLRPISQRDRRCRCWCSHSRV